MHEPTSPLARKTNKLDVAKGAENFLTSNIVGPNKTAASILNEGAKLTKELTAKIDRFSDDIPSKSVPKRSELTYLRPEEWSKSPDKQEGGFGSQNLLPSLPKQAVLTRNRTMDISLQGDERSLGSKNMPQQLKYLNQVASLGQAEGEGTDHQRMEPSDPTSLAGGNALASQGAQRHFEGAGVSPSLQSTSGAGGLRGVNRGFGERVSSPYAANMSFRQTQGTAGYTFVEMGATQTAGRDTLTGGLIAQRSAEVDRIVQDWEQRLQIVESKIAKGRSTKDYLTRDIIELEETLRQTNTSLSSKSEKLKELDRLLHSAKESAMKIATSVDGLTTALDREIATKFKKIAPNQTAELQSSSQNR